MLRRCTKPSAVTLRPRVEELEGRTLPSAAGPPVVEVHAGGSIQAALDAAGAGTRIRVDPGTYAESLVVDKPDIQIVGVGGPGAVVIANPGGAGKGVRVTGTGGGFVLADVTVRGFDDDGVYLAGVQGFALSLVIAQDDGEYGLFPAFCSGGLIDHCTASGHRDTGIYIGQSSDVTVAHCTAFANVTGFEVENSFRVQVTACEAFGNTCGILVDLLPGLPVTAASDNAVVGNFVHANNHPNFGDPHDLAAAVPAGSGVLVVGADRTTVADNLILGNRFTGVAVVSTLFVGLLAHVAVTGIDPFPDGTTVQGNVILGVAPAPVPHGADLLWDGSGRGNGWSGNIFVTELAPRPLPGG